MYQREDWVIIYVMHIEEVGRNEIYGDLQQCC